MVEPIEIRVPNIGDFRDIPIIEVLVEKGDLVRKDDSLITLESAKASVEVPSPQSGVVQEVKVRVGDRVSEGSVIVTLVQTDMTAAIESERLAAPTKEAAPLLLDRQRDPIWDPRHGEGQLVELSVAKRTEVEILSSVASGAIPSTLFASALTGSARDRLNQRYAVLRDTVLPPVVYEVYRLLRAFPLLNASYEHGSAFIYDDISIGIAIDSGYGLRVARIPDEAQKSVAAIEQCILDISEREAQQKLGVSDVTGTTFTISDLSSYGVAGFVPVLSRGQSAVLGIGEMNRAGEQIFSITFDHRVTEGRYVANFLRGLVERVESYGSSPSSEGTVAHCRECLRSLSDDQRLGGNGLFLVLGPDGTRGHLCSLCVRGY